LAFVIIGSGLSLAGIVVLVARREISGWNARTSARIAVSDRDPANHRPDRDVKWLTAGGGILLLVGLVMVAMGLAST